MPKASQPGPKLSAIAADILIQRLWQPLYSARAADSFFIYFFSGSENKKNTLRRKKTNKL